MTPHLRGKVQTLGAIALLGGAAAAVPLTAAASVAQRQSRGVVVLSTSVTTIGPHGRATITAVVRPGSLVPAGGVVTFIDKTNGRTLGAARLRTSSGAACTPRASSCRAKLSVSGRSLVHGVNHIIGLFNPQRLYYPSFTGATLLYRGVSPTCHAVAPSSTSPVFTGSPIAYAAARGSSLCRGRVRSGTGTDVVVSSEHRAIVTKNTVITFGSQRLPCSTRQTGDLLAYSVSGTRAPGDLALQVFGRAANIAHRAHPNGYICYESTIPFKTASGARSGHTANGLYYGSLPYCRDNDADDRFPVHPNGDDQVLHAAPCIEWEQYSLRHGEAVWTTWFEPTVGDPRASW